MKTLLLALATVVIAGCSTSSGGKTSSLQGPNSVPTVLPAAPQYEHQVEVEYSEGGASKFLRLVEVEPQ